MTSHRFPLFAVAVLTGAPLPTTTAAQTIPAGCRPLVDAERKTVMMPHHLYSTSGPAGQAAEARAEMISVGGASYLLYQGKWMRSPVTPKEELDQVQENISNAKAFSCRRVGAESVGGVPADAYASHDEHDGSVGNARIWVARGSGLVLRIEAVIDTGGGDKQHMSGRYEYTNVRAPAGVK